MSFAGVPEIGPVWPQLGVHLVLLSVARKDEIFVRVVLECHEGMGVARAHDPLHSPERTLLSLLLVPDFAEDARDMLADLASSADITFLPVDASMAEAVRRELP